MHEAALAQGRLGITNTVPYVLADMGHIALQLGDPDRAAQHFTEAHVAARQLGADGSAPAALGEGHLARDRGDLTAAARHYARPAAARRPGSTRNGRPPRSTGSGSVAALAGDLDAAEAHHRSAWQAATPSPAAGARAGAIALEGLAGVAAARGDGARAAEPARHRRPMARSGATSPRCAANSHDIDHATAHARDLLGDTAYGQAYTRGLTTPTRRRRRPRTTGGTPTRRLAPRTRPARLTGGRRSQQLNSAPERPVPFSVPTLLPLTERRKP